ncbi:MAG: MarR family transcriptional regulator [Clostridiales bacterium]|nr:MarR family transcriptional regulator [Clostridiales bacterium]
MACVKHPLLTIRSALKRRYAQEMAGVMEKWQLTGMEVDVVLFLGNNPGCDTASDMVQLCQLTKSHVSKAVDHLTEMGYITQERDQGNRRKVHLLLTDAARPVLKAGQASQKRFVDVLTRGLSDEERDIARRVMEKMIDNAVKEEA